MASITLMQPNCADHVVGACQGCGNEFDVYRCDVTDQDGDHYSRLCIICLDDFTTDPGPWSAWPNDPLDSPPPTLYRRLMRGGILAATLAIVLVLVGVHPARATMQPFDSYDAPIAQGLHVASEAWGGICADGVDLRWDADLFTIADPDGIAAAQPNGAATGACLIWLNPAWATAFYTTPGLLCSTEVHEFGHLAGRDHVPFAIADASPDPLVRIMRPAAVTDFPGCLPPTPTPPTPRGVATAGGPPLSLTVRCKLRLASSRKCAKARRARKAARL